MMRLVFSLALLMIFVACEKSSDDPITSTDSQNTQLKPLQGQLFNEDWEYKNSRSNLVFVYGRLERAQSWLYDSLDYNPCYDINSPTTTPYIILDPLPLKLGRHDFYNNNELGFKAQYKGDSIIHFDPYEDERTGFIQITELDTTYYNYIKMYVSLRVRFRSSTPPYTYYNQIEGWVEENFCRTNEKSFFKEHPLRGNYDGVNWDFNSGLASYENTNHVTTFALYSTPKDSNCVNFNYDTYPRLIFYTANQTDELTVGDQPIVYNGIFKTSEISSDSTEFPMTVKLRVENVDKVNNKIRAILDAYSSASRQLNIKPIELQGRFEVSYCY